MHELRVLNGLNRGFSYPLDQDRIVVGSSLDADMALEDPGISASHFSIEPRGNNNGRWSITPLSGSVWLENGVPVDKTLDVSLDERLNLGGVWVSVSQHGSPWAAFDPKNLAPGIVEANAGGFGMKWLWRFTGLAIVVLIISKTLSSADAFMVSSEPVVAESAWAESQHNTVVQEPAIDLDRLALVFRKMLAERNLHDASLSADGEAWTVRGTLSDADTLKLERMIRRFKKTVSDQVFIDVAVEPIVQELPFDIVRVASGRFAHVLTEDGHRLSVGDSLQGFRLVEINRQKLVFMGKRRLEVQW